ncbi:MAG: putative bifunctional diguanylate cyclase/phosphodiesterase [Huintestinicola sp.]|uniref:putative bifunctional diguanylate cyclase/phosphodiesterase n=1 Tax=Huintestinicola sp. TaxID=2981661 RepID=UPI003F080B4F
MLTYIILIAVSLMISLSGNRVIMVGRNSIPAFSINGILQAVQYFMCICMVCTDYKKGRIISAVLIALSILLNIREIVFAHVLNSLPGIINLIVSLIGIEVLCRQFEIRENDIITDFLTKLNNRHGLIRTLNEKTARKDPFYVMYIDLENFKLINDNLGHRCGDAALMIVSDRIKGIVGSKGTLGRIGGDEFILILDHKYDPEDIAKEMISAISEKIPLSTDKTVVDCYVSAFIGIAEFPDDAADADTLIKLADIAMYHSSRNKESRISFFNSEMENELMRQMELERIIKESLDSNNFYLVYQPQYRIDSKQLRGFESLIRLKTSDGVAISPAEFIPVAEKTDLILKIDDYVIRRVLKEFKEPVEKSPCPFTVSVNVSAKNIASPGFAGRVEKMIEEAAFPAHSLEIEITEYCLVKSLDVTIDNIEKLRSMGVQIALDDFGTGYTSLSYLAKLPINLLKIDKSLVDDIETDDKSREFANAVISMGHLMGCEVISEGVENENQLSLLSGQKCDFVQGFVWGRPLEYNAALELCSSRPIYQMQ